MLPKDRRTRVAFFVLLFLSLGITGYALMAYALLPLGQAVHPDMRATYQTQAVGIYVHIFAAAVALAIGPFQFLSGLRSARPSLHRWMGRVYLGCGVVVGGLAGLYMAFYAFGGLPARLGFGGLALAWLYTGLRAYLAIRAHDIGAHRRWMVRNFSLTFAAVALRIWLPLSMVLGIPFEIAYPAIAWICWVPNLVLAERIFIKH